MQSGRKRIEKLDKNCSWSVEDKTILLKCSAMLKKLNYQLQIELGDEFVNTMGRILCEFTFRPVYLSTDVQSYGSSIIFIDVQKTYRRRYSLLESGRNVYLAC